MGLFGNHRNDPAFGDRLRAAIATLQGDQGAGARFQQLQIERQRLGLSQQQALQQQSDRAEQIWGAKESGVPNPLISSLSPGDLSQYQREVNAPQHYSAEGGATGYRDPVTGAVHYEVAPYRQTVGRTIVGAGANGADPRTIYRGVEPVPVPNQGIFGSTDLGTFDAANPPPLGFLAQNGASVPETPPPAEISDTRPPGMEAPAFNANPSDLSGAPPVASFRGVQFGAPVANMPNPRGRGNARRPGQNNRAQQLRQQAQRAIQQGRDANAVRARLREMGVSDAGL